LIEEGCSDTYEASVFFGPSMIDSVSNRLVNKLGSGFSASSKIGLVLKKFAPEFAKTTCLLNVFSALIGLQCANGFI
jgi:hypothetical protein